ncbi:MAG: hypothetical protein HRK26_01250 [Rickettsiaceae bacterium H1]|nr:hypothetical protein [Rickettsiaceae bacterium H1]
MQKPNYYYAVGFTIFFAISSLIAYKILILSKKNNIYSDISLIISWGLFVFLSTLLFIKAEIEAKQKLQNYINNLFAIHAGNLISDLPRLNIKKKHIK